MAITAEQEKQKISFPEIVDDLPEEGASVAVALPEEGAEMTADLPEEGAAMAAAPEEDDSFSIDVDIDDMVWEVESESESKSESDSSEQDEVINTDAEEYYPEDQDYYEGGRIRYSRKMNKHLFAWLFSFMLGIYGVDRFVRGQTVLGVLKLATFGGFGFWYLADALIAFHKAYASENSMYEDLYFDEYGRYIF